MRNASFITSDPGHAKSDTPREVEAKTRRRRMEPGRRRERNPISDTSFMVSWIEDFGLICRIEVTIAKVHDSQVDSANEGEVRYAGKGLFRCEDKTI